MRPFKIRNQDQLIIAVKCIGLWREKYPPPLPPSVGTPLLLGKSSSLKKCSFAAPFEIMDKVILNSFSTPRGCFKRIGMHNDNWNQLIFTVNKSLFLNDFNRLAVYTWDVLSFSIQVVFFVELLLFLKCMATTTPSRYN